MSEQLKRFSLDYFSLKGKTAIITGANMGLGMAYAVAFAKAGADLYIPHFTDDIKEIKSLIEAEGRRVVFIKGDLSKKEHVREIVDGCLKEYGGIDILVNNAGISHFDNFVDYPDDAWKRCIDLDLNAVYYLGHEAAKVMIPKKRGKIINIGSALSFTADKRCPPYVTAKHGVLGLTRAFANELGEYNIQTNAICPGFLATEVNRELREDPGFYNKITGRIPAGRWGELDDLMGTAVFLASKASDYINGWYISIDGGFTTTL
jgi:2-deoxy-D-gluconate 3-dehydrogenase